jgi:endonuclease/exonuclease/phosphatase family metal-dependent hydrolase
MRVATFNILHGRSLTDDRVSVGTLADAVRGMDADVLALQEVDRNQPRSHGADLTAVAAEAMGAVDHRFVPALSGRAGSGWVAATGAEPPDAAAYGIALLSRHPVTAWEVVRLPALPALVPMRSPGSRLPTLVRDEPRVAVAADLETPEGPVTVANTHLSFVHWSNRRQLRQLVRSLAHARRPLVLMGDLNMGSGRATSLTGMRALALGPTFPADGPREQLDHVLADGAVRAQAFEVRRLSLSDHRALVVDLALGAAG